MEMKRIGFVGLGRMGSGMAKNLMAAGFPVFGYARDESKVEELRKLGCKRVSSPERMSDEVDVIILSLPNSNVVNEVVRNTLKLFEFGKKGLILIDATNADQIPSEELATQLREKGIEMLDAPVSGTPKMCAAKEMIFMVGGREETFKECQPLFEAMAKKTFYLGKNGTGLGAKLIVNLLYGLNGMALAEGLTLGKKAGMDQFQLLEILKNSAGYSRIMDERGPRMIKHEFLPPAGLTSGSLKIGRFMLDLGNRVNCPLPLTSLRIQALISLVAKGRGEWDAASLISFYEDLANV
jgi:2-hydroxy-3-oxopropionate reductase